ncbi:MAG: M20/M25/M40 family metallo-hydrolase [Myxococcaceae bacterium]|nr:M20/M25/M40 family metallo-hydrolase [Myxococcaceae bacterium]
METATTAAPTKTQTHDDPVSVLNWLAKLAPIRLTGTEAERTAQEAIAERLQRSGYEARWVPFTTARHIYGSIALHFGLALAAVPFIATWPLVTAVLHLFLAYSWYSESVRRRHVLRKLWPKVKTQNLLITSPSQGPVTKRIVLLAHCDSAFTGFLFKPRVLKVLAAPPPKFLPFMQKQLFLPWAGLIALGALALASVVLPVPGWLFWVLAGPSVPVFVLNFDILLRNTVVPGAADNLSGVAVQLVMAEEWVKRQRPAGVEVVFAFTGAEEGGTLGAAHLAQTMGWEKDKTEVLALDTLSNGKLYLLEEGELWAQPPSESLVAKAREAAKACGQPEPELYKVPAGGTDALPFLVEGYKALALTCVDPEWHAPRNYHHPNDTAENVDPVQLRISASIALELLQRLA